MVCTAKQLGPDLFSEGFGSGFGGGGFGGGGFGGGRGGFRRFLVLDEETLQGIADLTGGAYYRAQDAEQLYDVFADLPREIVLQKERLEISVLFVILGAVFAIVAAALALIWHRFP
jgi:Ca-activated chloride channel family protein